MSDELHLRIDSFRGYSAYEIAVQHGYTGTEEEWLNSLHGAVSSVNDKAGVVTLTAADIPDGESNVSAKIQAIEQDLEQRKPFDVTVRLRTSAWSESAPYTQTVAAEGVTEDDLIFSDLDISDPSDTTSANVEQKISSWGCVSFIKTGDGQITATCIKDKPSIAFNVKIRVIR